MRLSVEEWGDGPRTAVLVHGITSEGATWGRVAEVLAGRGYRVVAPSLRGHGPSRRGEYSPELWAYDMVETLEPGADLALGHSLGGIALLLAVDRLRPRRAVYEDPAWLLGDEPQRVKSARNFTAQKSWGRAEVEQAYPRWPKWDVEAKVASLKRWDPDTALAFATASDLEFTPVTAPVVPSLVMLADPSALVPPDRAERLRQLGWEVRTVPGAGHSIHRDDLDGFFAALEGWL